ncbi:MAG: alpha/beta-type small acid-soluble spore protein [Thermacetogeniaceae bacterium]
MARNTILNPNARKAMDQFKMEVANSVGVDYNQAYKGNLPSRDNGYVGGNMTRKVWEQYQNSIAAR